MQSTCTCDQIHVHVISNSSIPLFDRIQNPCTGHFAHGKSIATTREPAVRLLLPIALAFECIYMYMYFKFQWSNCLSMFRLLVQGISHIASRLRPLLHISPAWFPFCSQNLNIWFSLSISRKAHVRPKQVIWFPLCAQNFNIRFSLSISRKVPVRLIQVLWFPRAVPKLNWSFQEDRQEELLELVEAHPERLCLWLAYLRFYCSPAPSDSFALKVTKSPLYTYALDSPQTEGH